ncbi:MAG: Modulator of FtsH protease HflC [Hyphomicrobiaceae bacterium hypho_1]
MKRFILTVFVVILSLTAAAVYLSAFVVRQTQQAIVLEFGRPIEKGVITKPGLHWKIPIAQTVDYFDKRILDLDTLPQEVIASDQKRLVVDAYARFRISDPLEFYKTVRTEREARRRLSAFLDSSIRRALGSVTFQDVVRDKREELMQTITKQVNHDAGDLGIEVVDVRIKRADLPKENSEAIYRRMQTEREREAAEFRAEGAAEANRIRARADRESTVILAKANEEAEKIRGEGDAERNKIFAGAFSKDPDFFSFYRSMQAYETGLQSKDTRLVISPNSDFFRYFGDPSGGQLVKPK